MMLTMSGSSGVFAYDRAKLYADYSGDKTATSTAYVTKPTRRSSSGSSAETATSASPPPPYKPAFAFDLQTMLVQMTASVEPSVPKPTKPTPTTKPHRVYGDYVDAAYNRPRFASRQRY
ncbi:hypothetical protein SDRG_08541 [Saprolegnia diclina VS20]|uniref:Uncharacterized protein n=1 Tax=Saprolegnia diclina (strain VS20) TaxID=1156394 RepID=T0QJD6_SAPDV|nr:hypothetical protein SDRG_08541 [Saprolegnia diclina VS20]EQC33860.1 hypothetical protein SDRG_08541 [Saprolegnia diclina VS20]|eukprot:XP_008612655.1 hypothetical protein SDRG_08541 [Saprolegnia diclina VS20]